MLIILNCIHNLNFLRFKRVGKWIYSLSRHKLQTSQFLFTRRNSIASSSRIVPGRTCLWPPAACEVCNCIIVYQVKQLGTYSHANLENKNKDWKNKQEKYFDVQLRIMTNHGTVKWDLKRSCVFSLSSRQEKNDEGKTSN